ncbi:MAG: hypothetical protein KC478_11020 [Bacteriovoracaceae bacterium]|nr:hypothetical protein [Bacteriovoracaceae bacterium]
MKNILLGLLAFIMLSSNALAMFHVEPYVGFAKGEEDTNDPNPDEYSGMGFGLRAGYKYLGAIVGATYDSQTITASTTEPGDNSADVDFKGTNMGAVLGYEFPLGLRLWVSYYIDAKFEVDSGTSTGGEFSGNGYAIGAGYSIIPMILSLNAEMKKFEYDEYSFQGTTLNLNNAGSSYYFLSVSAPLSF